METTTLKSEDSKQADTDQLVALAQVGDKSAQRELFTMHRDRLKRMIAIFLDRRVAARVDPSDVLQETLACAARRLPDYHDERPGGFYPWLRQIARDRIIDEHRKHIRATKRSVQREVHDGSSLPSASVSRLATQLAGNATSPSNQAIRNERHERIVQAIANVSGPCQELLLMRYVEHLSIPEIAAVISISESAVKSKLWRALEKLRHHVGNGWEKHE